MPSEISHEYPTFVNVQDIIIPPKRRLDHQSDQSSSVVAVTQRAINNFLAFNAAARSSSSSTPLLSAAGPSSLGSSVTVGNDRIQPVVSRRLQFGLRRDGVLLPRVNSGSPSQLTATRVEYSDEDDEDDDEDDDDDQEEEKEECRFTHQMLNFDDFVFMDKDDRSLFSTLSSHTIASSATSVPLPSFRAPISRTQTTISPISSLFRGSRVPQNHRTRSRSPSSSSESSVSPSPPRLRSRSRSRSSSRSRSRSPTQPFYGFHTKAVAYLEPSYDDVEDEDDFELK